MALFLVVLRGLERRPQDGGLRRRDQDAEEALLQGQDQAQHHQRKLFSHVHVEKKARRKYLVCLSAEPGLLLRGAPGHAGLRGRAGHQAGHAQRSRGDLRRRYPTNIVQGRLFTKNNPIPPDNLEREEAGHAQGQRLQETGLGHQVSGGD